MSLPAPLPAYCLRTEFSVNPIGVDTGRPRLSWKLPPQNRTQQRAYRIVAGLSEDPESNPICDTGMQKSARSVSVPWPGPEVAGFTKVFWKVQVWQKGSKTPSPWSATAYFETAPNGAWKGKWISFGKESRNVSPPAPFLRKAFSLSFAPVQARLRIAALGLCDLEINGKRVHPELALIPGWSDFRRRAQTMTFDVTPLLAKGPNMLGCILGDGWYAGHLGFKNQRQIYGGSPSVLICLDIVGPDGKSLSIVSDETWQARTGPIISSDLYHGENYDARLELSKWSVVGSSRRGWQPVKVRRRPHNLLLDAKVSEPVGKVESLPAICVSEPSTGCYVFDLGQNIVGWARIRLRGKRGQTVQLRFAEMLNPDGTLYTANLRSARATDTYTFGENGVCDWEPRFTFHGFRYVELSGCERKPQKSAVTGVVLHNRMRPTGVFTSSDPRINQLASNIRWGLKGNFLEVPTDCPQRDERLGWSGDIQVFAKTASFFYDVDAFLTKWMRDLRDGQTPDGAFPDIAPTFICGFGNAAWADAGVIVPWVVYRRFGNERILEENYEAMVKWMDFQEKTSDGLVRPPTAYGDWLAVDAAIPDFAPVPSDFIGTAYFARTAEIMMRVATVLNKHTDAIRFKKLREAVVRAFRREYVTVNERLVGDCQTAYVLALAFDLLPPASRPRAVERLVEHIRSRNWHLTTGFVGTPLICPVLSRFGRHDVAMKLLLQDTYPSWLFTVKNGATTMWERWNSYTPEKGFGDVAMNSFNHYAYGAVGEWMVHYVAGLAPGAEEPAYRHILFRPQICEGLTSVSASLETPYGLTAIEWESKRRRMEGRLVVPPNAYADFVFPSSGTLRNGKKSESFQGTGKLRLLPGEYRFQLSAMGKRETAS